MTEANKEDIILVANFMGYFVQSKNGKSYLYSNEPPSVLKHHMDWNAVSQFFFINHKFYINFIVCSLRFP